MSTAKLLTGTMDVHLHSADDTLSDIADLLLQLRPQYSHDDIVAQIREQQRSGYQLAYVTSRQCIVCVAGFVIGQKLSWGKYLYIDDLVTDETHRSTGAGAYLINWLKRYGKDNGCRQIHLDSNIQKFSAHRFYLRERFNIASHHFSITDL